jgi:2'-5' RNA ligase
MEAFDVSYRRLTCFHSAVVVEVEGGGPRALVTRLVDSGYWQELPTEGAMRPVPLETFLPHMTLGVVNRPSDPAPLREALVQLRGAELGRQRVEEATLCLMPASRTTILEPWDVVGSVPFG